MTDRPTVPDAQLTLAEDLTRRQSSAARTEASFLRRGLHPICVLMAWLVSLSLLAVAVLRVVWHDGEYLLIWLNAFTLYVYLPAYICLIWAAWQRRWFLAAVCTLVVGAHLTWLAPDVLRDTRFEVPSTLAATDPDASPSLRVFFANVRGDNNEYASMLQEIIEANPDVIVLVEYGWGWHRAFKASPVLAPYKYGSGHLQSHIGSVNVFSRLPLKTEVQNWVQGRPMHTVELQLGTETLRLIGLHSPRPMNLPRYHYHEYWQQMIPLLLSQPGPLAIVGDLNATQHSRVYRQLTERRLRSAHQDRGRGYATTWPNSFYPVPPIRIDQLLISPEVECVSIREGQGLGSDHKPLIFDLRIRRSATALARP
jgi:endonuclease/exonuclease/phosphatase (EEP) superfamily protein YafD